MDEDKLRLFDAIIGLPKSDRQFVLDEILNSIERDLAMHSRSEHDRVVRILLTHEDARVPEYSKSGDAGADVYAVGRASSKERAVYGVVYDEKMEEVSDIAATDYLLYPGETVLIDLGLRIQLRPGWEMQVRSRSGLAKRGLVVANSPGTIDSGYRGPCMVLIRNTSPFERVIRPGTRVAQFVLKRAPQAVFEQVDSLDASDRGEGGFGSTGTQ